MGYCKFVFFVVFFFCDFKVEYYVGLMEKCIMKYSGGVLRYGVLIGERKV